MDIPDIGSHCSLPSCHDLDFLPISCPFCHKPFCRFHSPQDAHSCPVNPTPDQVPFEKLQRCALENCSNPSLDAFAKADDDASILSTTCSRCQKSFCAYHRHPDSHTCPSLNPPGKPSKNEAARALLAKHFPATSASKGPSTVHSRSINISDPNKLAQIRKVELMKLRHRAVPADPRDKTSSVSVDQRLHVKARFGKDGQDTETMIWLRKSVQGGKALDLLAAHLRVSSSDASPIELLKFSASTSEWIVVQNDQPLETQIEDGTMLAVSRRNV